MTVHHRTPWLLASLTLLVGCGKNPTAADLDAYLKERLAPIVPLETKALSAWDRVGAPEYEDEADVYETVRQDVLPPLIEFADKLEAIRPSTDEVRGLHELYIASANKRRLAFVQMLKAMENSDLEGVISSREKLDEARKIYREYERRRDQLCRQYGVGAEQDSTSVQQDNGGG